MPTSQRGIYQEAIEAEGPLTGGTPSMDLEATRSQGIDTVLVRAQSRATL